MNFRTIAVGGLITVIALTGCATRRDRRWGYCALAGGLVGAAAGAGTAGGLVEGYEGGRPGGSNTEVGAAAGGGAVAGAVVGTLVGHFLCDPVEEAPPPPPPAAPPPPPPAPKKLELSADTNFDFNSAKLKPAGEARVDEVVRALKGDPHLHVRVEGHTDSVGSDAYNMRLSERRANSVRDYMVAQGIESGRIATEGYGESKPEASNKTAEGRARNRRVEITTE